MNQIRRICVITLALFSLAWTDKIIPGLLLASAGLTWAIIGLRSRRKIDITVLVVSALVLQTFSYVQLEFWRNVILAMTVRLSSVPVDIGPIFHPDAPILW